MDNPENPTTGQSELNDLRAQYQWLRRQIVSILVLLIVVSGTLNVYLLRQMRFAQTDLKAIRTQGVEQMIARYTSTEGPKVEDFVAKIKEYGRTHPDFAPILAKYRLQPEPEPAKEPAKK